MSDRIDSFITAAEKKNFTQTAKAMCLTQPAVTHQIQQLEEEMGAKLFDRSGKHISLTPEGRIALKYARRIKALEERMKQDILNNRLHKTELKAGITHTSESNDVAEVLARYSSESAAMNITILTEPIQKLYSMLDTYELDMAIVEEKPQNAKFTSILLDTDCLVCIVSADSRLAHRKRLNIQDLKKEKLILRLPGSETRSLLESHLLSIHESLSNFRVILEVDNIATIKNCVRKNLGISILARSACMSEIRKGKLVALPIENLNMTRETYLVYHKDFDSPEIIDGFVDLYRKATMRKPSRNIVAQNILFKMKRLNLKTGGERL